MGVLLRTQDQPTRSRLDFWQSIVGDSLVPVEMYTDYEGGDYAGTILQCDLGDTPFASMAATPVMVRRTPALIRRSDRDLYTLLMHTRGRSVVSQGNQETMVNAGDLTLVDTSRPYRLAAAAYGSGLSPQESRAVEGHLVALNVPRAMLPLGPDAVARVCATTVSGGTAPGALAAAALTQIGRRIASGEEDAGARLAGVVVDLLGIGLADQLDAAAAVAPEVRDRGLVRQMQTFIEQHLDDPGLSPGVVAAAHHVSVRHVHKLFESEDVTVAERIRTRRLERTRAELCDPDQRHRPVWAVAARWGFGSAAQFNRAFRDRYGLPPATFRRVQLDD